MTMLEITVTSIATLAFIVLLILTLIRLRAKEPVILYLALYAVLGLLLSLSTVMPLLKLTPIEDAVYSFTARFMSLAVTMSFGSLTLSFLRKERSSLIKYGAVALPLIALWFASAFNLNSGWNETRTAFFNSTTLLPLILAGLSWAVAMGTVLFTLTLDAQGHHQSQYINKLRYWLISTVLMGISSLILLFNPPVFNWGGVPFLVFGTILAGYAVLSHSMPDLALLLRQTLRYMGATTILAIIFFFSLIFTVVINRNFPHPATLIIWSIVVAVLLANIVPILWKLSDRILTQIIIRKQYHSDKKLLLQRYSNNISSALDINRMGNIIIEMITETFNIERSAVFVNERNEMSNVSLRPLSSTGIQDLTTGYFAINSPFVDYFRRKKQVLNQYDVELLSEFKLISEDEQKWLSKLDVELYVPIIRQRELVGLLAFGTPTGGIAYGNEDFELMIAMADQAALAMDSARLFEQLANINKEVGSLTDTLADVDQNKADFLSIASHELRTPMTHIHGYSRMLLDLTDDELKDPAYVKSIIKGVAKGSERMKSILDLMFDVTEANVGEMSLSLGPVGLEKVIDQATQPFLAVLDKRRIAFAKMGTIKEAITLEADGSRLVQAFENLIGNAIKYTPDGGLITIESRSIVVDDIGSAIEVVISDTGIGIDKENHKRIFEKFFRVDDTDHHSTGKTKFKGAGPGLGLTLVKAIAEAHGGRIWVESKGYDEVKYHGSKFFFVIPLHVIVTNEEDDDDNPIQSQIETRHWRSKDLKEMIDKHK